MINKDQRLNKKAETLKIGSEEYKKESKELKSVTRWGDLKLKIAIGSCAIGGVGYGVYYFFFK